MTSYRFFDVGKGEYRWYWGHGAAVRNAQGEVTRWFGTSIDIHERKLAEMQLAESERSLRKREEQLALLFESVSIGDFLWDFEKGEVTAHPTIWALFGEPGEQGQAPVERFTRRYHPDDAKAMGGELQAALEGTKPLDVEYRVVWPDGTIRWLASKGVAIRDAEGRPIQMHGFGYDITERKLAALQVQESERHFREMADAMPQIVWRSEPNGEMDYCNARWFEYTGYTIDDTKATLDGTVWCIRRITPRAWKAVRQVTSGGRLSWNSGSSARRMARTGGTWHDRYLIVIWTEVFCAGLARPPISMSRRWRKSGWKWK